MNDSVKKLTTPEEDILIFLIDYASLNPIDVAPKMSMLTPEHGNEASTWLYLRKIQAKGYIKLDPQSRGIKILRDLEGNPYIKAGDPIEKTTILDRLQAIKKNLKSGSLECCNDLITSLMEDLQK